MLICRAQCQASQHQHLSKSTSTSAELTFSHADKGPNMQGARQNLNTLLLRSGMHETRGLPGHQGEGSIN